jgi:hypothetical protein
MIVYVLLFAVTGLVAVTLVSSLPIRRSGARR